MIPFQIDPTLRRPRWLGASPPRHAQSRRTVLPRWWLAASLFIAVAAVEAAIVLNAGPVTVGLGNCCSVP